MLRSSFIKSAAVVFALGSFAAGATYANTTLKVAVNPVPHAEILNFVKPILAKDGVDLKVVEFTDYVLPNVSLVDKSLDANYFQTVPFLNNFNKEQKQNIVALDGIHIEPLALYSQKVKSLKDIKDGALIAIANDATNTGRALLLLQASGLIKLKDGVGFVATPADIVKNPKNLKFKLLEAALLARVLPDADAAVINANYALSAKLNPVKDSLFIEPKSSPYANVIAVRKGDEKKPEVVKLIKTLKSEQVRKFIEQRYKGAVVPAF
jgi:D-methionine transport system substrate-binding protein